MRIDLRKYKDPIRVLGRDMTLRRIMLAEFIDLAIQKGVQNFTVHGMGGQTFRVEYMLLYDQGMELKELATHIYNKMLHIEEIEADVNQEFCDIMEQIYLMKVLKMSKPVNVKL